MDPQQRLVLEYTYFAFQNANYSEDDTLHTTKSECFWVS